MTTATETFAEPVTPRSRPLHAARAGFRNWRRSRPFWAGVWAILGGALIAYVPATAFKLFLIANASLIIGVLVGALVAFFGLMLWFARPLRVILGVLILLLSLVSFLTSDFGGLLLGMLMGLIGGSLALAWVPSKLTWRQRRRIRKLTAAGVIISPPEPVAASPARTDGAADAPTEQFAEVPESMPEDLDDLLAETDESEPADEQSEEPAAEPVAEPSTEPSHEPSDEPSDESAADAALDAPERRPQPRHSSPTGSSG